MDSQNVVSMVKNGQIDSHWMVFRYSKMRSFLMLLYKIFFTGIFLAPALTLWIASAKPLNQETAVVIYGIGGVGVIGLLVLLRQIYTMFFLRSNMIVLTENEVVKSVRGKINAWAYSDIEALRQVVTQTKNTMPTYSVEFKDKKSGKILELARGREFGPSQDIFTVLQTRIH